MMSKELELAYKEMLDRSVCKECCDGEFYPIYGKAPHTFGEKQIDKILPPSEWESNFEPELMEGETIEDCHHCLDFNSYCDEMKVKENDPFLCVFGKFPNQKIRTLSEIYDIKVIGNIFENKDLLG